MQPVTRTGSGDGMDGFEVLVVNPDLHGSQYEHLPNAAAEVGEVINSLGAKVLQGEVTQKDLARMLSEQHWDLVWFSTHGRMDGILLSDGVLKANALTQMLNGQADAVYLNTCESAKVGLDVHEATGATVILTVADISDGDAYLTGVTLARKLVKANSIYEAYELSKPFGGDYRFIGDRASGRMDRLDLVLRMLDEQREDIQEVKRGLADVDGRLTSMERYVTEEMPLNYRPRSTATQVVSWLLGSFLMVMVTWGFYYDVRQALDISFYVAGAFASIAIPVSLGLVGYGVGMTFPSIPPARRFEANRH